MLEHSIYKLFKYLINIAKTTKTKCYRKERSRDPSDIRFRNECFIINLSLFSQNENACHSLEMRMTLITLLLCIGAFVNHVRAYPTGAPPEACDQMLPTGHNASPQSSQTSIYSIQVSSQSYCASSTIDGKSFCLFVCLFAPFKSVFQLCRQVVS